MAGTWLRRRLPRRAPPSTPRPIPGRDGFLFLGDDANDVIGQHTGRVRLGSRRRRAWRDVLAGRVELMAELGVPWRSLVAPDKETVYAEMLPPDIVPAERRPIHDFLDAAREAGAPVVFPMDELDAAKSRGLVYYETDTHWTQLGAYVAYDEMPRLGQGVRVQFTFPDSELEMGVDGLVAWLNPRQQASVPTSTSCCSVCSCALPTNKPATSLTATL